MLPRRLISTVAPVLSLSTVKRTRVGAMLATHGPRYPPSSSPNLHFLWQHANTTPCQQLHSHTLPCALRSSVGIRGCSPACKLQVADIRVPDYHPNPSRLSVAALFAGSCVLTSPTLVKRADPQGIDVSRYQGSINWNTGTVKANGVAFAYIKATEGTTHTDPNFSANCVGATNAGLIRGGRPDTSTGAAQAKFFPGFLASPAVLDAHNETRSRRWLVERPHRHLWNFECGG
ncbi:glycoside hydrolase family 25 protein [Auriscalpium vulgare]|uniref:Glycoside hydrolase family 25 protein n=1 Tax=Auriscalpium vulgare TaxID=40419 RepID=A0ACB8RJF6_9AGAM|nr:glycoside hydrolase family 25 protein [Auriscalpium vulgare]